MPCVLPAVPSGWWLSPLFSATLGRFWSSNHVPGQTGASIRPFPELHSPGNVSVHTCCLELSRRWGADCLFLDPSYLPGVLPSLRLSLVTERRNRFRAQFSKTPQYLCPFVAPPNSVWVLGGVPLARVMESYISLPNLVSSLYSNQGDNTGQRVISALLIPHCPRWWIKRSPALVRKGKEKKTTKAGSVSQQFWELSCPAWRPTAL